MTNGLHWIDFSIIGLYGVSMLALGWYYSRQQTTTDEYFVGNRAMNPLLIGVSLFATLFSTISYLSTPGELIKHGPVVVVIGVFGLPLTYYVVAYLLIPVFMRYRATSAYELLEAKVGLSVRLTGATLFILLRLMWMSLLIFFASKAMLVMLGLDDRWLQLVALITGAVAIFYSSLGGLKAVVITDLFQTILLFGGAVLVIVTVTSQQGFDWIPTKWSPQWDTQPFFSFDPRVRVTVVGSLIAGVLWWVCTAGSDQTAIQRFMATKDEKAARRSFLTNSLAGLAVSLVLTLVGFALLGFYTHDANLPEGMSLNDADGLFPYYISHHLPIGVSGLVVAGMFAAAMSSLDSGINSITAVVMTDFVSRFRRKEMSELVRVRVSRVMAVAIGVGVVSASALMEFIPGNFLEMTKRTIGLFVTPLFTLFFMALFVPRATPVATICGSLSALLTAVVVAYWSSWDLLRFLVDATGLETISFQWIFPSSLLVGIVVGCLITLAFPSDKRGNKKLLQELTRKPS